MDKIDIFADGTCKGNPGTSGWELVRNQARSGAKQPVSGATFPAGAEIAA